MTDNTQTIGWDSALSSEEVETANAKREQTDFIVLPKGEYAFRVAKVEKGDYNGSEKIPPCGCVKVGIICEGDEGSSYITTRFFMVKKCLWTINDFMASIGIKLKEGSCIPWGKVDTDCTGMCKIDVSSFKNKNGEMKQQNEVKSWISAFDSKEESDY